MREAVDYSGHPITEAKDFLGQEIKEGVRVVYPVRSGSEMWFQYMKVSGVHKSGNGYRITVYDPASPEQRSHSVKNLHTVLVVKEPE